MGDLAELINKYGFPIIAAGGLGYFVYYVWQWVTNEIKPVTGEASKTLVDLIDRIRMLDNDLIRLNQKVNVILSLRTQRLQAAKDAAALANNTNLSKFLNNFESRVYAQLSTQLVNNLFGENPQNSGTVTIEGNTIQYTKTVDMINLTVTGADGTQTQIQIPIGQLKF